MNKKLFKLKLLLLLIIVIAGFLRFWQLGQNPPSLSWDEVAWGYNAYSLGIDGRDEFGKFLPVQYLESFGDFKPPVYAYLDILPVKSFGLTEFAVRFPSALLGTLTVLVTYFLVKRIFYLNLKSTTQSSKFEVIALLSALFLAISPWHINLSRAGFEANVATFFMVVGVWLFLWGIQEKRWYIVFSVVSFILSTYTFNTARVVAPLIVLGLAIGFRNELLKMKKQLSVAVIIGVILIAPLAQFILTPQAQLRFHEVNIFSDIGVIERINREIVNDGGVWWSRNLHNRRFAFAAEYLRHYFDHFNPSFLFIRGDGNPKFSTQDVGQLYLWDLPFLIAGMLFLFRRREGYWWIVPLWLLIGIIPAATARETPHALRIETTLPTFQIITAIGFAGFLTWIRKTQFIIFTFFPRSGISLLFGTFLLFNFLYYHHGYYAHYPREFSGEWQYGYKEMISYIKTVERRYDEIVFTEALGRPYIYVLFYTKEDPKVFRKTANIFREVYGFVHVRGYGKYIFIKNVGDVTADGKRLLYVDIPDMVPKSARILNTISLLNGQKALVAYSL